MAFKNISFRIDEEFWERLQVIAYCERRSIAKQAVVFIEQSVKEYEQAHCKSQNNKP